MSFQLCIILFLLVSVQADKSIKCYNCSSVDTRKCGERFDGKVVNVTECPKDEGCLKVKHPTIGGGVEPISRGCYDAALCDKYSVCYECHNKDLCNSSVSPVPSFVVTFVTGLICACYYL